jgi:glycosyltransferase involved in cell wall biosynthesis
MKPKTLSVAIATFNEENNITRCLDSVNDWVDEIIIVDGQSADRTPTLAQSYSKVTLISTPNVIMFHQNKQKAIDHCHGKWILQLDADEEVSSDLKKEIQTLITQPIDSVKENGFWINRRNYFLGRFLKKGGQYPDPTIRLYKNGKAHLPCQSVHEQAKVTGSIGHLTSDLLHYADPSFTRYLSRFNRYTTLIAQDLLNSRQSIGFLPLINYYLFKPISWFFLAYLRHRGYVDGFPGFVFAFFSALRFPVAYTKLWELKQVNRQINPQNDWEN